MKLKWKVHEDYSDCFQAILNRKGDVWFEVHMTNVEESAETGVALFDALFFGIGDNLELNKEPITTLKKAMAVCQKAYDQMTAKAENEIRGEVRKMIRGASFISAGACDTFLQMLAESQRKAGKLKAKTTA